MSRVVQLDKDALYRAWRTYLKQNSVARNFGAFDDKSVAVFPYATLTIVGMPTNATDLTIQTDCYIDSMKILDLFRMDEACTEFFNSLGFRHMGDSMPTTVQNSNVKRITSRYQMRNFAGRFLIDLNDITN